MTPVLLYISSYGWGAIILLLLSVALAVKILRRAEGRKTGCASLGYVSLILFIIFSITVTLFGVLGNFVYNAFELPRYKAIVVGHDSYINESRDEDRRIRRTTMYQPILVFKDRDGREIKRKSDIASSSPAPLGSAITVGYQPGMTSVTVFSATKYLLIGGASLMLLLLVYCSVAGIVYALGGQMKKITTLGLNVLLYFLIPLAMLGFIAGLGYAVTEYFRGNKPDMPLWALVICIFFCVTLLLAFLGYVRMLAGRKSRNIT